jgi:cytoskeletal protein CcmA (bactofilin family)
MFQGKKQPDHDEGELTQPSPAPTGVNPAMVAQLNKAARYAQEAQNDAEAQSKTETQNQKLIVGPGIRVKGEITNCDTFAVEGHVEGSAKARVVEIAKSGTLIGDIEIKTADISGQFDGSLNASERLVIRSTGRVSGQIRYKSIEIEAGGRISGDVQDEEEAKGASLNTENPDKTYRKTS